MSIKYTTLDSVLYICKQDLDNHLAKLRLDGSPEEQAFVDKVEAMIRVASRTEESNPVRVKVADSER